MPPATRKPDLRFDRPSVLSDIDQPRAVVLARRRLYQQASSNDHLLLPTAVLADVHRLRPNQIHRHARRCRTQPGTIEFLVNSIDIAFEMPYGIGQQHSHVRRTTKAIERMEVTHNLGADSAA